MEITEIRIKLMESSEDRLRAFCSITIDGNFVVRDLKIIDGTSGPFVAMPSRKLSGHCQRCHHKNHLRASYCNNCGIKLQFESNSEFDSPQKLYADVAHPINSECREMIQSAVIQEFEAELSRAGEPGYRSRYDDDFDQAEIARDSSRSDKPRSDQTRSDRSGSDQVYVDPAQSKTSGKKNPGRPKFMDTQNRETSSADANKEEDGSFGQGIF